MHITGSSPSVSDNDLAIPGAYYAANGHWKSYTVEATHKLPVQSTLACLC